MIIASWIPLGNVLSGAVYAVCFVIALIMINARSAGRSRRLGVLGVIALFFCIVLGRFNGSVGPWLNAKYPSGIDYYGLGLIIVAAIGVLAVLLLVAAAIAGRTAAKGGH